MQMRAKLPNTLPKELWTCEKKQVPITLTGTIKREFKNGCFAISINELDGAVHHFAKEKVTLLP